MATLLQNSYIHIYACFADAAAVHVYTVLTAPLNISRLTFVTLYDMTCCFMMIVIYTSCFLLMMPSRLSSTPMTVHSCLPANIDSAGFAVNNELDA